MFETAPVSIQTSHWHEFPPAWLRVIVPVSVNSDCCLSSSGHMMTDHLMITHVIFITYFFYNTRALNNTSRLPPCPSTFITWLYELSRVKEPESLLKSLEQLCSVTFTYLLSTFYLFKLCSTDQNT